MHHFSLWLHLDIYSAEMGEVKWRAGGKGRKKADSRKQERWSVKETGRRDQGRGEGEETGATERWGTRSLLTCARCGVVSFCLLASNGQKKEACVCMWVESSS